MTLKYKLHTHNYLNSKADLECLDTIRNVEIGGLLKKISMDITLIYIVNFLNIEVSETTWDRETIKMWKQLQLYTLFIYFLDFIISVTDFQQQKSRNTKVVALFYYMAGAELTKFWSVETSLRACSLCEMLRTKKIQ